MSESELSAARERMWSEASALGRVLAVSLRAAERAGREIKAICAGGELGIVDKGRNDLQTAADRRAQATLVASLRHRFGTAIRIIAEEALTEDDPDAPLETAFATEVLHAEAELSPELRSLSTSDLVVWIDPLDGTREFAEAAKVAGGEGGGANAEALEQATVLVGVAAGGRPVAGLIHQPFFGSSPVPWERAGRSLWALRGGGLHGLQATSPDLAHRLVLTTRSHGGGSVEAALNALKEAGLAHSVLRCGGAGYKVLRMLEGGAAAYIFASAGTKKWDTCGPEAVLAEAGGHLSDVHGSLLAYDAGVQLLNSAGLVATAKGVTHGDYVAALPKALKDSLPPLLRSQSEPGPAKV